MTTLDARVATAQLDLPAGALDGNRERILEAIRSATGQGAHLVILPELAQSGYRLESWREVEAAAEPIPGPTTELWRAEAEQHGCYIVGGICERDGNAFYNSVALVGPDGVLARYRKLHLFENERLIYQPGNAGLPVVTLPFGRVGVVVCYDLRFPEAMRILALQGADLVAVPTAWAPGFDRTPPPDGIIDQVKAAAVQANLNQVWVACASRSGADGDLTYLGSSVIVNPYGRIEYGPAPSDQEAIEVREIDLAEARRAKVRHPLITPLADRRTDVYTADMGYAGDPPAAYPPARPEHDQAPRPSMQTPAVTSPAPTR
jgi:N-carbamoylputrescine amidase